MTELIEDNASESTLNGKTRGGGPRLNEAEWIVLMRIHQKNHGMAMAPGHPDLQSASFLLSELAGSRGNPRIGTQLRSPAGLARRLAILRSLDSGKIHGAPKAALAIWRRFRHDPTECNDVALEIIKKWTREEKSPVAPARGPSPWTGCFTVERKESSRFIYIMVLEGVETAAISLTARKTGAFIKIGMTSSIARRGEELNRYFPPGIGMEWRCVFHSELPDPLMAYETEQYLLQEMHTGGRTLGSEFVLMEPSEAIAAAQLAINAVLSRHHLLVVLQGDTDQHDGRDGILT